MGHNLFNRCCHFAYGDAAMWLKCGRHPNNEIFTQNVAMSATPVTSVLDLTVCCPSLVFDYEWNMHGDLCVSDHFSVILTCGTN